MSTRIYAQNFDSIFGREDKTVAKTSAKVKRTARKPRTRKPLSCEPAAPKPQKVGSTPDESIAYRVLHLVQQHEDKRAAAKELYAEAERLEMQIQDLIGIEKSIALPDGRTARIVDNFRDKHGQPKRTAYRVCGVSLTELAVK
ncbi:MAG: hypothetical protein IT428_05990 [Planctomycetaceae bacterium]|nr:hypothetical protein [Planctomycetaceae bacterium]